MSYNIFCFYPKIKQISFTREFRQGLKPLSPPRAPPTGFQFRSGRIFWGAFCSWDPAPCGLEESEQPDRGRRGNLLTYRRGTARSAPRPRGERSGQLLENEVTTPGRSQSPRSTRNRLDRRCWNSKIRLQDFVSQAQGREVGGEERNHQLDCFSRKQTKRGRGTPAFHEKTQKSLSFKGNL